MQKSFFLIVASVLACASATVLHRDLTIAPLLARQSGAVNDTIPDIPSQCNSPCAAINTDIENCENSFSGDGNDNCGCTSSARNDLANCLQCITSADPATLSGMQALADETVQDCSNEGSPVSPIKLTAGGKNGGTSLVFGHRKLAIAAVLGVASYWVLS